MLRVAILAVLAVPYVLGNPLKPEVERHWTPIRDDVYLQEVCEQIATPAPVQSVTAVSGRAWERAGIEAVASMGGMLHAVRDGALEPVTGVGGGVVRVQFVDGALWALTQEAVYRIADPAADWETIAIANARAVVAHAGDLYLACATQLYRMRDGNSELITDGMRRPIIDAASYAETLYFAGGRDVFMYDGESYNAVDVADWGEWPGDNRALLAGGGKLYAATGRGLAELRGSTIRVIAGEQGLPYEDLTCVAAGFGGDIWIGSTRGAMRHTAGEYHYFAGRRYLPDDRVHAIAVDVQDKTVYVATEGGLGIIRYEPYTLLKKAAYYERHLEEWGQKRLGFVHKLEWNAELNEWVREVSDNDAGWSTHYLAAQCFKYAVTGDRKARREAISFFNSLKWTEEISGIRGFPARSIWARGEKGHQAQHGSGGFPAEWHQTPDGLWEWKGDTSSDEIDAHIYAAAIFYELVARGEDRRRVIEHVDRICTHIIDNGWTLRDVDGRPTVWARWDPEYLQGPRGFYARGLNGLEILSFMRTAHALTGDAKYEEAYAKLLGMRYHEEVLRQKLVFPPDDINHSDDRLAFYVYYPLLAYERNPHLRSIYRRSLERSFEIERMEHVPWFNFIYGGLTGNDCEAGESVKHLREWPLDLVDYSYQNSHRADIRTPEGYIDYVRVRRALSPRERGGLRWSDTPHLDGGSGGYAVVDPSGWLDAYWMGRYYGIILPPDTTDPALTTVPVRPGYNPGAKPYDGPPRPN